MARKKREIKIYTLDTETLGFEGGLKRIAIYDGVEKTFGYKFRDVEWKLIEAYKKGYSVHVYIHNLEFDARKLEGLFEPENVNWDATKIINGRYAVITCKYYTLHDSFRLMPRSLDYLSKSFGVEHGKMDLMEEVEKTYPGQYKNKEDFFLNCDKDDPVYVKYLGYDVMSLYELLEKLMDVAGITKEELVKRMSAASLARYILKHGFKGKVFQQENSSKTDYELITLCKAWRSEKSIRENFSNEFINYQMIEEKMREAYFGGRTEVFIPRIVKKPGRQINAYYADRNSMYPAEMIDKHFPIGYPEYDNNPKFVKYAFEDWQRDRAGLGFIKCVVHVPKQFIPPLPVHMGKLVFPAGVIEGTWTYVELEYAMKHCGVEVLEWKEVIHFKKTSKIFKSFIETFSEIKSNAKANGEGALEYLAKLLQNVSYGWTALRRDDKTELHTLNEEKLQKYGERLIYTNEEYGYFESHADVRTDTIQVQIACYVTSYARLNLLDLLRKQNEKGLVYYCDTDSIVCEAELPPEILDKYKLGMWDIEQFIQDGIFIQPKVYATVAADDSKGKVKFKGVSHETQKKFDFAFYESILSKLQDGDFDEIEVETNKLLLRSIRYAQKTGTDPNKGERRTKKMYLFRKQKRDMEYEQNFSLPWYFETLEEFKNFSFKQPVVPHKEIGDLIK